MKICVTADWQFDLYQRLSTIGANGVSSRLSDQIDCLRWAVGIAVQQNCKAFAMLGDIFDSRTEVDISVIDAVCRFFHEEFPEGMELYILVGNHDSYLRSPAINSLQMLRGVATVIEKFTTLCLDPKAPPINFVPWNDDEDLLEKDFEKAAKNGGYLFSHCMVDGAVPMGKGLPVSILRRKKFKHVLLGDVHDPVEIASNVCYVGSPMQLNYGDAGKWRGILTLDLNKDVIQRYENTVSPRFVVLEDAPGPKDKIKKGDFVRVKTDDPEIAAEAVAKASEAGACRVESTLVSVDDAPPRIEMKAQDSQEDVLRRYVKYNGLEDEELVKLGLDILAEAQS